MRFLTTILLGASLAALTGCGGGSGGSSHTPPSPPVGPSAPLAGAELKIENPFWAVSGAQHGGSFEELIAGGHLDFFYTEEDQQGIDRIQTDVVFEIEQNEGVNFSTPSSW